MTAIKCAAVSARLPNVDAFLSGSSALVSHLKLITQTLLAERCRRLSVQEIYRLSGLLKKPVKLKKSDNPMDFAARRFRQCDIDASFVEKVPGGLTNSLRGVLLDRIHAQYLKAISRLQMKDFRTRHHRGLLKAGYCFGPFNPVSNIIVNTIWYDTVFPATEGFEVDMICTMTRVESRSLDGLIKLLLVSISKMSEHDAMVYLLKNNLKPRKAIRMARQEGHDTFSWDDNAYKTAADAASHPQPEAYVEFVLHSLPMVQSAVKSLLKASYTLSSDEVLHLSRLLSPSRCNPTKSLEPNGELTKDTLAMLSSFKEEFISQQSFVRRKIEAALQKYKLTKGDRYELHIICGVNANVGKKRWMRDLKRQYSHVNFWASSKDGTCPTLFFAEFSNDEDSDNHQSFCYPVSFLSTHVRCCYCEFQGTRIVHPLKSYWGGAMDFQQMACGEHKLTNARIISHGKLMACPVGIFEEDYIYLDPSQDTNLVRDMNNASWELNLDWGDELRRIKPMRAASGDLQVAH
uniref:Uncharacterized protein n=1 Tax=Arundo donax TaxID=35708 RepID=A0A0A9FXK7_ARUDO